MRVRTTDRLLRLYPPAWRERYGDEFAALLRAERQTPWLMLDVLFGAVDAWMRPAARLRNGTASGDQTIMSRLARSCEANRTPFAPRDAILGAAVIVGGTAALKLLGHAIEGAGGGFARPGHEIALFAFPVAMLLSLPATWLKGRSRGLQVSLIGSLLVVFALMAALVPGG
jgi:hypothetical protein